MNIELGRLRDLINLIIIILIILIGLFQILTINNYIFFYYNDEYNKYYNYNKINKNDFYELDKYPYESFPHLKIYPTSFDIYKYFEYFKEITEFFVCLFMFLIYCFCFFKRLFTGGIKTQYQINIYKTYLKNCIVFNYIYMFLSLFLLTYGTIEVIVHHDLFVLLIRVKLIIHSSLNLIIMIIYIVMIYKNFTAIKYINNIEKEMNLINNENNIPKDIKFTDLNNLTHILKPIIYNNYKINLFYELEGKKIRNKMNKEKIDFEINDLEE